MTIAVLAAAGLTVRDEAALTFQPTHAPPAGGGDDNDDHDDDFDDYNDDHDDVGDDDDGVDNENPVSTYNFCK